LEKGVIIWDGRKVVLVGNLCSICFGFLSIFMDEARDEKYVFEFNNSF
jgi:hypothetical protein